MLSWKIHRALINTKLESHLGFLNSTQYGKPSLVCDFQELYRHLVDDFLIQYSKNLNSKDFKMKCESMVRKKKGKRIYLNDIQTRDLMKYLNEFFEVKVNVPRIRVGKKQSIETLITEETLRLSMFLRNEKKSWIPEIAS